MLHVILSCLSSTNNGIPYGPGVFDVPLNQGKLELDPNIFCEIGETYELSTMVSITGRYEVGHWEKHLLDIACVDGNPPSITITYNETRSRLRDYAMANLTTGKG